VRLLREASTSDDHIPPKTIFGDKKPSDLITVPACEGCNNGCSLDDEYFKQLWPNVRDRRQQGWRMK